MISAEPVDAELLRRYAEENSEAAFAALVQRHLDRVYAVALRRVGGDAHRAEEVAQSVFTDLARKAVTLARHPALGAWLFRSTRFAAAQAMRAEQRRGRREQATVLMQSFTHASTSASDPAWSELRPVLDELMERLPERDRVALWLRFFEGRPFAGVGVELATSEDAARVRVDRALEKLRAALARRGIVSTAAALGGALASQPIVAAPAGLAASVTGAALAGAAASSGAGAALAIFTMSKLQIGIAAAIIVAGLATAVVESRANGELRSEVGALRAAVADTARLTQESRELGAALKKLGATNPEAEELARLRERVAQLKARPAGVDDASMKSASDWGNVGRDTPAHSLETGLWAAKVGDGETYERGFAYSDDTKARMRAYFATLSDSLRARYGTPEHFFVQWELAMLSRQGMPAAFQVVSQRREFDQPAETVFMQIWYRASSGEEKPTGMQFRRDESGWVGVGNDYSDEQWARKIAQIDPATGGPRLRAK